MANNFPAYVKNAVQGTTGTDASTVLAATLTAAANDFTGAGANNALLFTADATNGSFVRGITVKATGTNVASVARLFLNNGATNATASNNAFISEMSLPSTTANAAGATATDIWWPLNLWIQKGFKLYVGLGTSVAGGWEFVIWGGDY